MWIITGRTGVQVLELNETIGQRCELLIDMSEIVNCLFFIL